MRISAVQNSNEQKAHAGVPIRPLPLVPALLCVVGGPTGVEVPGVGLAPVGLAPCLHPLPARILKLLLFPSLYPIQSCATGHHPSRVGVLPAPLADMRFLGQETGLVEPPLAFWIDVPLAHAGLHFGHSPRAALKAPKDAATSASVVR